MIEVIATALVAEIVVTVVVEVIATALVVEIVVVVAEETVVAGETVTVEVKVITCDRNNISTTCV